MKVLVTGASGFLGAHVARALRNQGAEVRALVRAESARGPLRQLGVEFLEGDLLDESSLEEACRGVDGLIHCAARTGSWSRQNDIQRRVNVEGTTALLRAAQLRQVERIVHVSSVAAVGAARHEEVLDEGTPWNLAELEVNYALTKRLAEERVVAAARAGMPIVVVNPSAILGPRLDGKPPSGLITGVMQEKLPWVPPGGISVTDVRDVAAGILAALSRGRVGERYILAGHNTTWSTLYEAIAKTVGGRAPARRLSPRALKWLTARATLLDHLRLARPPRTPEIYRSYGWYSWFRSDRAARELGYAVRPLPEIIADSVAGAVGQSSSM